MTIEEIKALNNTALIYECTVRAKALLNDGKIEVKEYHGILQLLVDFDYGKTPRAELEQWLALASE